MFFLFSKLLNFLINPLVWILAAMVYALWTKKERRRKKSLWLALGLFLFFSNEFLSNQLLHWWEKETITADQIQTNEYDIAILLGGYGDPYTIPNHDRFNFAPSANRFTQTYELYRTGKIKRILLTGGKSDIWQENQSESILAQNLLLRLGVPDSAILLEPDARNTRENALFTQDLLDKIEHGDNLLITSAFHMKRAKACYDKVGISYTPYAVDHRSKRSPKSLKYYLVPDSGSFSTWKMIIKEWIGFVVYRIAGYV
ncbi:MAG: YdcF family protein [Bacteroidota bacterium]